MAWLCGVGDIRQIQRGGKRAQRAIRLARVLRQILAGRIHPGADMITKVTLGSAVVCALVGIGHVIRHQILIELITFVDDHSESGPGRSARHSRPTDCVIRARERAAPFRRRFRASQRDQLHDPCDSRRELRFEAPATIGGLDAPRCGQRVLRRRHRHNLPVPQPARPQI